MKKLSILDKNAYLSILVTESAIYSTLSYSHYDIDRKYNLSDTTMINLDVDRIHSVYFWDMYFEALEDKFDWEFLSEKDKDKSFRNIVEFEEEGEGVAGIRVTVWNNLPDIQEIVTSLRTLSPSMDVKLIDQKKLNTKLIGVAEQAGYDDLIHLDLSPFSFRLNRIYKKDQRKNLKNLNESDWESTEMKIRWDNRAGLIESIRSAKFKAFLATDVHMTKLVNLWANYLYRPTRLTSNKVLLDILRAFATVQLYSIYNDNQKSFEGFGLNGSSGIVVTGTFSEILPENWMLLAILDGLQIRGSFDIYYDRSSRIVSVGDIYALGVNSTQYILPKELTLDIPTRVYVPEVPGKGNEKKVVFSGEILEDSADQRDIYALTPEIVEYEIKPLLKTVISGKFVKGAYVEGIKDDIEIVCRAGEQQFKKVVIDCRFKPAIYGPEPKSNRIKINSWLHE